MRTSYDDQGLTAQEQRKRDPDRARSAARELAELMSSNLSVRINPTALRLFLAVHWSRVSELAHTIHNNDDD